MDKLATKWDLSHLFPNEEAWKEEVSKIEKIAERICAAEGKLTSSATALVNSLKLQDELGISFGRLYVYAKLLFDQDMSSATAREIYEKAALLSSKLQEKLSFLEPELLSLSPETLEEYEKQNSELITYRFMFEKLFQKKKHILTRELEEIISRFNSLGESFEKVYDDLTINDTVYPEVSGKDGQFKIIANSANYYQAMASGDRVLRENFFRALLGKYAEKINTLTSAYYGNVKHDVYLSRTRNYESARGMALHRDFIPEKVYDNLISTVKSHSGVLQEYLTLRQKTLGLEELHFYDLFVPLVEKPEKKYSFAEAKEIVFQALAVLGEDYLAVLETAFAEGWIDVYPAEKKATGAYAIHTYGKHPYVMLNYTETLEDIFTLAHELGHMMHSYYSMANQPYVDSEYSIFTAEVASTVNEQLLFNYLSEKAASREEKAALVSNHLDGIRSTFYRQAIFADFEQQTHKLVEDGQPLLPEQICALYKKLYRDYYGESFVIDPELTYEWSRIPHFYRAFYVFQYSTGIAAAVSLSKGILRSPAAVAKYRTFLTSGGSDYPIELLKNAGVDMSSPEPILDIINHFADNIRLMEKIISS